MRAASHRPRAWQKAKNKCGCNAFAGLYFGAQERHPPSSKQGRTGEGQGKAEQYRAGEAAARKTSAFPRCLVSGGPHAFAEFNWVLRRG